MILDKCDEPLHGLPLHGVIYLVSHRSLPIKFWALRTSCETQSKKLQIKKIICEVVQSMHRTRFAAACAIAIASTISRKLLVPPRLSPAPVLDAQFPDLRAHSFRYSSTRKSTWWGSVFALEDFLDGSKLVSHCFLCVKSSPLAKRLRQELGMREREIRKEKGGGGEWGPERRARKRTGWKAHIESETQVC